MNAFASLLVVSPLLLCFRKQRIVSHVHACWFACLLLCLCSCLLLLLLFWRWLECLPESGLKLDVVRQLRLPTVTVGKQLGLVVQQLLVRLDGVLEVGAEDDGIDGASLLC